VALRERELAPFVRVCQGCGYHLPLTAWRRIAHLTDRGSFVEWDGKVSSRDLLGFVDRLPYRERLERATRQTGLCEAILTGEAKVGGRAVALGVFDFRFMGGSMGSAVGEKLARLFARAGKQKLPLLIVVASGGARMQEGCHSLLQMAKVTAAAVRFKRGSLPYIALLTNPTTGGVAASVAFQADIILAEPGAVIGFAGRRVMEETIGARLPANTQLAEVLQSRGLVDAVIPRPQLALTLSRLLLLLGGGEAVKGKGGDRLKAANGGQA